MPGFCKSQYNK